MSSIIHTPVLLSEVLELAAPQFGEVVVDATLGLGGHAAVFLEKIGRKGKLIGLDADARNLKLVQEKLSTEKNIQFIHSNFRELVDHIPAETADIVLFDLGISSLHLDDAERGFSFRFAAPLDMRLDTGQALTAAEIVNTWSETELAEIFQKFGEIHSHRKLAAEIKTARRHKQIKTTTELRRLIEEKVSGRILGQAFQAIRIAVNNELDILRVGLEAALTILKPGGRLVVISFHSLEDRIVKNFFRDRKRKTLEVLTKKPIIPTDLEITLNPRARSAKLRVARKMSC